ncbi:cytidine deaminase [Mycoplasma testudineum]|nr:cytidine deaminase [Mycoplasma testudineum]OYD26661.1 cytidine deaminase [Mycoplasma testudineum]
MYEELKKLLDKSYSPYSNFPVAAIVIDENENKYYGVNVENAAYPSGLCAERSAMFGGVAYGLKVGTITEINVISKNNEPISPCGACRQVITEFVKDQNSVINLFSYDGKKINKFKIKELIPLPVVASDIKGN